MRSHGEPTLVAEFGPTHGADTGEKADFFTVKFTVISDVEDCQAPEHLVTECTTSRDAGGQPLGERTIDHQLAVSEMDLKLDGRIAGIAKIIPIARLDTGYTQGRKQVIATLRTVDHVNGVAILKRLKLELSCTQFKGRLRFNTGAPEEDKKCQGSHQRSDYKHRHSQSSPRRRQDSPVRDGISSDQTPSAML